MAFLSTVSYCDGCRLLGLIHNCSSFGKTGRRKLTLILFLVLFALIAPIAASKIVPRLTTPLEGLKMLPFTTIVYLWRCLGNTYFYVLVLLKAPLKRRLQDPFYLVALSIILLPALSPDLQAKVIINVSLTPFVARGLLRLSKSFNPLAKAMILLGLVTSLMLSVEVID